MVNTAAAVAHNGVLRSKEDTIDYMSNPNFGEIYNATHRWQVVKRNSSREIQGQISDSDVDFKLMGYTIGSDPVFFPNDPTDITPIAANAWTTVDISSLVSVDDDGVILFVYSEADNEKNTRFGPQDTKNRQKTESIPMATRSSLLASTPLNTLKPISMTPT